MRNKPMAKPIPIHIAIIAIDKPSIDCIINNIFCLLQGVGFIILYNKATQYTRT